MVREPADVFESNGSSERFQGLHASSCVLLQTARDLNSPRQAEVPEKYLGDYQRLSRLVSAPGSGSAEPSSVLPGSAPRAIGAQNGATQTSAPVAGLQPDIVPNPPIPSPAAASRPRRNLQSPPRRAANLFTGRCYAAGCCEREGRGTGCAGPRSSGGRPSDASRWCSCEQSRPPGNHQCYRPGSRPRFRTGAWPNCKRCGPKLGEPSKIILSRCSIQLSRSVVTFMCRVCRLPMMASRRPRDRNLRRQDSRAGRGKRQQRQFLRAAGEAKWQVVHRRRKF